MRNRIIALSYCIILLSQYLYGDNVIIADDIALQRSFNELVQQKESAFRNYLEPYSGNKYLSALRHRRFLPSLLSKNHFRLMLAVFRCEAYRDIMLEVIDRQVKK